MNGNRLGLQNPCDVKKNDSLIYDIPKEKEWETESKIERSEKRDQYNFRQRLTLFQKAYHVVSFSALDISHSLDVIVFIQ